MKTFWRWTGALFFALAFIFLTVAGIGTTIPIAHSAQCSILISAPADRVFDKIADERSSVAWRPELRSVALVSGSGRTAVWRETYKNGRILTLRTVTGGLLQGPSGWKIDDIVRSIPFDPRAGFDGVWTFVVFASHRSGPSAVSIKEEGHIYNPVFRFLSRYIIGYSGSLETYLTDLSKTFGQTQPITCPSPTPAPPSE